MSPASPPRPVPRMIPTAGRPQDVLCPPPFDPPGPPPLSADERALLDAVIADPDADGPRLRYADWCDRQGAPRGAFIRGQVEEFHRRGRGGRGEERFYSS